MRRILTISLIVLAAALLVGGGYFVVRQLTKKATTLTVWTLPGTQNGLKTVADAFNLNHPDVAIKIVPVSEANLEFRALYALAGQQGPPGINPPDVWIMPNEWLPLHRPKLLPAPDGSLDAELNRYQPTLPSGATTLRPAVQGRSNSQIITDDYAPIVATDLMAEGKVWGVPLNSDTLGLCYRQGLVVAPKTWTELVATTKNLTQKNGETVNRSIAALGNESVDHAIDIMAILMLQNGVEMVKVKDNIAGFNLNPSGPAALDFYASFAQAGRETYSWNATFGRSLAALKAGKTNVAFGYSADALGLDTPGIACAPLPQVDPSHPKTYGRYLAATVTKQASQKPAAWQFVATFAAPAADRDYARATSVIPARLDAAATLSYSPLVAPFAGQTKTAVNWPKKEVAVADGALAEALRLVKSGQSATTALDVAGKAYTTFLQTESGLSDDPKALTLWQSSDDTTNYRIVSDDFLADHKDIPRVLATRHSADRLEWELLNAAAARLGPDIVGLPGDRINRLHGILRPFPDGAFNPTKKKAADSEVFRRLYVPALRDDNVIDGKLYGLPATVETLALAYNVAVFDRVDQAKTNANDRDYFDHVALFSNGPTTWDDVKTMAAIAAGRDGATLTRPFLALGGGQNVAHAGDIYAAFVKQAGGDINDPDRQRAGIQLPISSADSRVPGREALDFILNFSDPKETNYTWNKDQPNSLEALADGIVAMAFVYPRDMAVIAKRNPSAQIKFFPLPQIDTVSPPVDFASSFSLAVPRGAVHAKEGLSYIQTVANQSAVSGFISPLRTDAMPLTLERGGTPAIERFQANTAESYFKGNDPAEVDRILADLSDRKVSLDQAATRLNQSLAKSVWP